MFFLTCFSNIKREKDQYLIKSSIFFFLPQYFSDLFSPSYWLQQKLITEPSMQLVNWSWNLLEKRFHRAKRLSPKVSQTKADGDS